MRHLYCARCARIVIADFWTMLDDETVPTFSTIRLTCTCGHRIKLDLALRHLPALPIPELRRAP
jgi:hypothetical protein